ncbi:unnamed protein product [Cylindrotheca closterium]|uniref:G domain-containing protein n=1 Tax=Cylindrotheca closterium TaxID=2856 RepID=A0AAD2CAQ7_9STRA|nr:unnamed protein product [Cylindrotheca closterium]
MKQQFEKRINQPDSIPKRENGMGINSALYIMINVLALVLKNPSVVNGLQSARSPAHRSLLTKSNLLNQRHHLPSSWFGATRLASSERDDSEKPKKKGPQSKKIKLKEITPEKIDALAAAFDDLARKEGFDSSLSRMADDDTFEDYFDGDEDDEDDEFMDDDDDFLDFGSDAADDDMDARIAAAQKEFSTGRVSVPKELEEFASKKKEDVFKSKKKEDVFDSLDLSLADFQDMDEEDWDDDGMDVPNTAARRDTKSGRVEASDVDLRELGYKREANPFGNDETPRKKQYTLISDAMTCQACGSSFQSTNEQKPGFLPDQKFETQVKLAKIEEMQKLQDKAETKEWTVDDEIEYLIQTSGGEADGAEDDAEIDVEAMAEEMELDLVELSKKKVICKRCHSLQNTGKVEEALRPGWTDEPTMSQEKFRNLLKPIREKPAVIIALIDLFDFSGSVLRELDGIAGDNPVILAANKADLLPKNMGKQRAENWVRRELEHMGVQSIANVGGAVRLISCKTGFGVLEMLGKARKLADKMECDIYVVGAANAGKSTLINNILASEEDKTDEKKKRAGNRNAFKGALTASPLPGTTLKFIKIDLGDGMSLYDTPGLLVPGTITQLLTPEELKIVCPKKQVEPITFRVSSGKCVLVGGLAKIEVIGDTKPFLFTFFVANEIKLHPTSSDRSEEFIKKHAGTMLTPPFEPGEERMEQLGEFESHIFDIEGSGWKEAAADITLTGLGWVAVTGAGTAKIKLSVPKGIGVSVRPPLMPFDVWEVASKYTGGRATRKIGKKSKSGKRRKGVGRN